MQPLNNFLGNKATGFEILYNRERCKTPEDSVILIEPAVITKDNLDNRKL